jgi:predicted phosphodiesterase
VTLRVVCISDTHSLHAQRPTLPPGDVLVHAGDLTESGTAAELADAFGWLLAEPHPTKIIVPGNHDFGLEGPGARARVVPGEIICLVDDGVVLAEGLRLYGMPWLRCEGFAFDLPGYARQGAIDAIPDDTAILVTHGPMSGVCDRAPPGEPGRPRSPHHGDERLAARVSQLTQLRLMVHGHIHEGRGEGRTTRGALVVNVASLGGGGRLRPAVIVEVDAMGARVVEGLDPW